MDETREAMISSRASELIKVIEKWNVSARDARDILSAAETLIYDSAWKVLLKDITGRASINGKTENAIDD